MSERIIITTLLCICICTFTPIFAQQTIHIMVALCDNKYQGIVKVPKGIGNGQDPKSNLYWGCGYGISTYFRKSTEWKEVKRYKINDIILERIVFRHTVKDYYLIADAYDGRYISDCTVDFLKASAGQSKDTILINNKSIGIQANAKLVAYVDVV